MKKFQMFLLIIIFSITIVNVGKSWGSDWKYAGGAIISKEQVVSFYDSESVKYLPNGNVKVWMKSIKVSEMVKVMKKKQKEIIDASAEKLGKYYIPPYCLVSPKTTYHESIDIISWEEIANIPVIKDFAVILYEVSCENKMMRHLSVLLYKPNGETISSSEIGKWDDNIPDSTGEAIQKILCK